MELIVAGAVAHAGITPRNNPIEWQAGALGKPKVVCYSVSVQQLVSEKKQYCCSATLQSGVC